MRFLIALLTTLRLLWGHTVGAQDVPPAQKPPEQQVGGLRFFDVTEVTVVNVDVSVRDKKGPVLGLTKEDFLIFQDGKQQEITHFAVYRRRSPASRTQPTPSPTVPTATPTPVTAQEEVPSRREPRFLTLYVDNENIHPLNRNRVMTRLVEFVHENLRPPDQVMVASFQKSLKIIQPYTSDPQAVADALRTLRRYTGGRTEVNTTRKEIEEFINQNANNPDTYERALGRVRSFAREQRNTLIFSVRALQEIMTMMAGLPGKKAIIYVSDGLPMSPGLELFYELQERYRETGAVSQSREFDATELFRSLVNAAAAANITVYTIDARGLESDLGIEAEHRVPRSTLAASIGRANYQDSLIYMADQTGGLAIVNTNDVGPGLEKIATDFETYYSLGYRLIPTGEDRVHRIEVKVKNHPQYELSYRRTFIEKSLPTRIADRVITGLAFDLEDNPLEIELRTGEPAPASDRFWTLPVEIRVPIAKLALVPSGDDYVGSMMVYYAARDDEGKQSDLQRRQHDVRIPKTEYEAAQQKYFTVTASLLLEPGVYRISVGVRDVLTNQAGYASTRRPVRPELR
ncbi:MAG: VWA domain-containing protein [Thermoanaerobaculum sp.]|nr:VWA domain-containing protein [Thermoanaerobaculum sp.]MDW7968189.1 VWA domain-containing protein [Thermoanaerobaculum sp.]